MGKPTGTETQTANHKPPKTMWEWMRDRYLDRQAKKNQPPPAKP
jgi:hypothetical protein